MLVRATLDSDAATLRPCGAALSGAECKYPGPECESSGAVGHYAARMNAFDIGRLDGHAQASLLRSGEITPLQLTEAAITRIEYLNPALNALTVRCYELARARANSLAERPERAVSLESAKRRAAEDPERALAGVPYLLKDSLDYPGLPTRFGSRLHAAVGPAASEYEYSRRLDAEGLIPLGKSNVPEFSLLPTSESLLYGAARNPWSLEHSPGGSSGGAAVAVASGMVPLAHAADGGGSIRIPASCCGVLGLKPGRGGNVRARAQHIVEDLLVGDTLLSRTVRDAAWAFSVMRPGAAGQPAVDLAAPVHRLRIAVVEHNLFGDAPHPHVAQGLRQTADLCASLGHEMVRARLPFDTAAVARGFQVIWAYLALDLVEHCRGTLINGSLDAVLEPWTLNLAHWARQLESADLDTALRQVALATAALDEFHRDHPVILSPTLKHPPVPLGRLAPTQPFDSLCSDMFDYVSYTPLHNLTGTPALSVPLFMSPEGLPIGSMFAAARGGEAMLLQLAHQLEQAAPWAERWPPHSAGVPT